MFESEIILSSMLQVYISYHHYRELCLTAFESHSKILESEIVWGEPVEELLNVEESYPVRPWESHHPNISLMSMFYNFWNP